MNNYKVSVITVCYNAEATIYDTVNSVLAQDYPNLEYIVIDGNSKDKTLEIVRSFDQNRIKLISEPDLGLYDAINKGISLAASDIIGLLHADDNYAHNGVIQKIVTMFNGPEQWDAVSSSVNIFKKKTDEKPYRFYNAAKFKPWMFRIGMQPPHPGFFIKKAALEKVGYYRIQYKISGDFDWLLRAICIHKLKVFYTSEVSVHMQTGGVSSSGWKSTKLMNNEDLKILKSNGIYSNKLMIYLKYFLKIFQIKSI